MFYAHTYLRRLALIWGFLAITALSGHAAETNTEVINLWQGVAPGSESYAQEEKFDPRSRGEGIGWVTGVSVPTIKVFQPASKQRHGTGVVICPGGGYGGLAIEHEGYKLAEWFADRGVVAAVLKYRHGGGKHQQPVPLNDAQRALRIMRSNAEKWQLEKNRIGIAGFSAGGHLASSAGTRSDDGDSASEDPIEQESCRADFVVLAYPVITMREDLTHKGSKNNLLGKSPTKKLVDEYSNELQVSANTGPTFITHAADDPAVPVENALLFYEALRKHKIPAELHIFATGGHGYGMFRRDQPADQWPNLLEDWLKVQQLIK